jgi:competence protein ComEC
VLRILDSLGVDTVDNILLTHPHVDHYNGLRQTLLRHPVKRWLENNVLDYHPDPGYDALERAVDSLGIPRDTLRRGDTVGGYAHTGISVLWPLAAPLIGAQDNINGNSVVIQINYQNVKMLFPGDFNQDGEQVMADSSWLEPVDLLKAGHHGSLTSSSFPFLLAVKPRLTVVPVHQGNEFHLPSEDTMQRYAMLGLTVYRMDQTGSLHLVTRGESISRQN